MAKLRKRGEEIRQFILENIQKYPNDIVQVTSKKFDISRQAVNKHVQFLAKQQAISISGATKSRRYRLCPLKEFEKSYLIDGELQEDVVWRGDVKVLLEDFPGNVIDIWSYCFTEMFNNAIDHSSGNYILIKINNVRLRK
jgi:biotin operon repressor